MISTTPIRNGRKIPSRSGTSCAPQARSCTPSVSSAATCRRPMRRCARSPTTPSISPRAASSSATCGRRSPANAAPPITSDPPVHKPAKQLLLPPFTPDAMKKLEPRVRAICNELIDEFIADGQCDAAARYTKHIPVRAIAHMLGIPEKRQRSLHQLDPHDPRTRHQGRDQAAAGRAGDDRLFQRAISRQRKNEADRRPDLLPDECQGQGRPAARGLARAGLAAAAPDRRHRHHLERDRLLALAPRQDARRPRAPGRRARS